MHGCDEDEVNVAAEWRAKHYPVRCECGHEMMAGVVSHGCERWICRGCGAFRIRDIPKPGYTDPTWSAGPDFDAHIANTPRIERIDRSLQSLQKFVAILREEFPAAEIPFTIASHRCARCNATLDEASVEGHGERCFVVGDWVRWERDGDSWAEGELLWIGDMHGHPFAMVRVASGAFGDGSDQKLGVKWLRRIQRTASEPESIKERVTLYDGLDSISCWYKWCDNRACLERGAPLLYKMTPAQIAAAKGRQFAISEQHSEQLRARIDAARERERVRVQAPDDDAWLANCKDAEP